MGFLALSLCVGGRAASLPAQTSPSGLPISGWPSAVALAGGGAVAWGDPTRSVEYPALAIGQLGSAVVAGFGTGAPSADLRSFRLGAVQMLGKQRAASVTWTSREMTDLIEDPSVSDDGLRISDWELRLGVAQRIGPLRAALGLSAEYERSAVFSTRASKSSFGMSMLLEPTARTAFLFAVEGLGPSVRYRDADARERDKPQARRALASLGVMLADHQQYSGRLYIDYERGVSSEVFDRVSLAGEAILLGAFAARAGLTIRHDADAGSEWERLYGLGFSLRVSAFELDCGFSTGFNPDDLAPRQHFGFAWQRRRSISPR